jgi:hypothetical protein
MEAGKTFAELCAEHAIWVLKYTSPAFEKPVFFIWYTDPDGENDDKLLLFRNERILATHEPNALREAIEANGDQLVIPRSLADWLAATRQVPFVEDADYNLTFMERALQIKLLTPEVLAELTDFINLFGDYFHQLEENDDFQALRDDEYIDQAWNHYYDHTFWPRMSDPENFSQADSPPLEIDTEELLASVVAMREAFEERLGIVQ